MLLASIMLKIMLALSAKLKPSVRPHPPIIWAWLISTTHTLNTPTNSEENTMGVFDGCQVSLELDSSVRFKVKLELKKKVIDNGGIISFIVTKKVSTITSACHEGPVLLLAGSTGRKLVLDVDALYFSCRRHTL